MDILNELAPEKFAEMDDLLAFVSIYDDENRTAAYLKMLEDNKKEIKNKICVEAGCGFGILSEKLAQLGAKKVYAVEVNPRLFDIASKRLQKYKNVEMVQGDIRDFSPMESIDVLVHELFGQLLYDEDILSLNDLQFIPTHIMPNQATLMGACVNSDQFTDDTVNKDVLDNLKGALVSGLFDDEDLSYDFTVAEWASKKSQLTSYCDVTNKDGDLIYMGLHIYNNGNFICKAGECDNWSIAWTPRSGNNFELSFKQQNRGTDVHFEWLD